MERVQKKEERNNARGMNLIQMATIVGNQAAVQMMPKGDAWGYTDVCTPHFIRKHLIDGCAGTKFRKAFMDALADDFNGYVKPSEIKWHGTDFTFRARMFAISDDGYIHHYHG